jgi:hypothetical protein
MGKIRLGICILICFLTTIGANARVLSPRQEFEVEVRKRYSSQFSRRDLSQFISLPWTLEQLQKAERLLKADAIRMAVALHDYSGLLSLSDDQIARLAPEMLRLLDGEFRGFWLKLSESTRDLLFDNPELIEKVIQILQKMSDSEDADEYKRLLAEHPDALVFLYRFPSLIRVSLDRLPILLHFLQHVNLSDQYAGELGQLNEFLAAWNRELLPLYIANMEQYGPAPALTMWMLPEFFSNKDPDLSKNLKQNDILWRVLLSQMGFIRERHEQSADWPKDVAELSGLLINRKPRSERLFNEDWLYALLQTAPANGKLLQYYWELRENNEATQEMDAYLQSLKGQDSNYAISLDLLKYCVNSQDYLFMLEVVQAPVFKAPERALQPYTILHELEPGEGDVLAMLKEHREKLLVYLTDKQRGKSVKDRWSLAQKTNLKDAGYDESTMKMLVTKFPGGNVFNVAYKAFSGYPITKTEMVLAAVDVVRAGLAVATMGGSDLATMGGAEVAKEAAGEVARETTEVVAEKTVKSNIKEMAKGALKWIVENEDLLENALDFVENLTQELETITQYYENANNHEEFMKIGQRIFEQSNRDQLAMGTDVVLLRFDGLPLRKSEEKRHVLMRAEELVPVSLPSTPRDWLDCMNGKSSVNSVLLVTLRDLK